MLLAASAVASLRLLLLRVRRGGGEAGAPPSRIRAAEPEALARPPLRSSVSSLTCARSPHPSPSPSPRGNDSAPNVLDEFSVLSSVIPWEADDIWRTYAGYFFIFHIPLSFGGLDVVAKILHRSSLDPITTVVSTVILQLAELALALALLQYTAIPGHDVQAFFAGKVSAQRNWIKETSLGSGILITLVLITSILADKSDAYDPVLKEALSDSPVSALLYFFLYSVIAPLSEETIYRGFLLTALSSSVKWWNAVLMSSLAFSVAHFSGEGFIQLFLIGCITGLAYCRTGTLAASFTIHALYNAVILYLALVS